MCFPCVVRNHRENEFFGVAARCNKLLPNVAAILLNATEILLNAATVLPIIRAMLYNLAAQLGQVSRWEFGLSQPNQEQILV